MSRLIDLTGQRFGMWMVKEKCPSSKNGNVLWLCECACENHTLRRVSRSSLNSGKTKSCGCLNKFDLVGQKFGKLTVVSKSDYEHPNSRSMWWVCICDCGREVVIPTRYLTSVKGFRQSCGCNHKRQFNDLTGMRFGMLVVKYRSLTPETTKRRSSYWYCECDCGKATVTSSDGLKSGHVKSCGCKSKLPYGEATLNRIIDGYKKSAKERGLSYNLTREEFKEITSKNCYYCDNTPGNIRNARNRNNGGYTFTGIDRLDSNYGYEIWNVVPSCFLCNKMKTNLPLEVFLSHIQKIINNLKII
jgi:hypothetical protein